MIKKVPEYPPEPVGVSIKWPERPSHYYAWGHETGGNNCSFEEGRWKLEEAWLSDLPTLFHHAKFDLAVAYKRMGLMPLPWDRVHDTMHLAFLADPHSRAIDLKGLAEELLGWAPEARDAVAEWLGEHADALLNEFGIKIRFKQGVKPKQANKVSMGENLAYVPGNIVEPYASGDTERTAAIFDHLWPLIIENGMSASYDRERQVMPIFLENELEGIRVDMDRLRPDVAAFREHRGRAEEWVRQRLKVPDLNLDSDEQYAEALSREDIVDDDAWTWTAGSKTWQASGGERGKGPIRSVSKDNLKPKHYNDPRIASAYGYYKKTGKLLGDFMEPWLEQGAANEGYVTTTWNQTRGFDSGTRTGRPSTKNPNFLNIAKKLEGRSDGYRHPDFLDVTPLPLVRRYILPDEDSVFIHRDFDGQELRIFAHFEQGELFHRFLTDPRTDVHDFIRERVLDLTGHEFERTIIKNSNFGKIYGAGVPRIMELMQCGRGEAHRFSGIHGQAMPGIDILNEEIKRVVRSGDPIKTWGGRLYFPEEPKRVKGRWMDFEYKLLNYIVQGSAAECTKEALIRWYNHPDRDKSDRFLVTVYDEINISARFERWRQAMKCLREAMESIELDVPMLSSPKIGFNWGDCLGQNEDKSTGWVEPEVEFLDRAARELHLA